MSDNFTCPADGTRCESELCSFGCELQRQNVPAPSINPELLALRAENERLRQALAILNAADEFEGEPDSKKLFVAMRVADLRRARAALETKP